MAIETLTIAETFVRIKIEKKRKGIKTKRKNKMIIATAGSDSPTSCFAS